MSSTTPFTWKTMRGVTVVSFPEQFTSAYEGVLPDLAGIPELAATVDPPRMVVDLRHVRYIGSAFIGFLISLSSRLRERPNGRLGLSQVSPFVRMALQTTRSDELMEIHDALDDAVAALATE